MKYRNPSTLGTRHSRNLLFSEESGTQGRTHQNVIIVRKENKGKSVSCFHSFLEAVENAFLQKISHYDGKEEPVKVG